MSYDLSEALEKISSNNDKACSLEPYSFAL